MIQGCPLFEAQWQVCRTSAAEVEEGRAKHPVLLCQHLNIRDGRLWVDSLPWIPRSPAATYTHYRPELSLRHTEEQIIAPASKTPSI